MKHFSNGGVFPCSGWLSKGFCVLDPDDFGTRIAFVDYDGKNAFEGYKRNTPKSEESEIAFVKKHAPRMVEGIEVLQDYINKVRSDSLEYCAT